MSDVLSKVRKLLDMARSGTEHEAALAAERAADLMQEHGLSEAEVRLTDQAKKAEPVVREAADVSRGDKKIVAWKGALAHGVCAAHGVKFWWHGGEIRMLGRASAVQAANYTLKWLANEVERLTEEGWHAYYTGEVFQNPRTWRHAFRVGCAARISARLVERAKERPELRVVYDHNPRHRERRALPPPPPASTALVLLQRDAEEVCDAYTQVSRGFRGSYRGGSYSSGDGYAAGRAAGDRVGLSSGPRLPAPAKRIP